MTDLSGISLHDLFDEIGINLTGPGRNVSSGWVGLSCPFCGDHSNHLGINIQSKKYSCWSCSAKGSLPKLIKEICKCEWNTVFKLLEKHNTGVKIFVDDLPEEERKEVILPTRKELPQKAINYLKKRKLDPEFIVDKYDVFFGGLTGFFKFRIILPVYQDRILVSATSRDITGLSEIRYKGLPSNKSIIPLRECIYGLDIISEKAILVEGPFDVYPLYPYGIAMMGLRLNPIQMYSLYRKKLSYLLICLDRGTERKAEKIALNVSSFIPKVEIALLETGKDPGECIFEEIMEMKKRMIF